MLSGSVGPLVEQHAHLLMASIHSFLSNNHFLKLTAIINRKALAKQGDNALGSIRAYVCLPSHSWRVITCLVCLCVCNQVAYKGNSADAVDRLLILKYDWSTETSVWRPSDIRILGNVHLLSEMGGLRKIDEVWGGVCENYLTPIGGLRKINVTTSKVVNHFLVKTSILWGVYENFWITWGGLCKFRAREGGSTKNCWIYRNFDPSPSRQY